MRDERDVAWLTVMDAGLPRGAVWRLLSSFESPEDVLRAGGDQWRGRAGLTSDQAVRLADSAGDRIRREQQFRVLRDEGIEILEASDTRFPARLRHLADPPAALFLKGQLDPDDAFAIALVGPRLATPYGLEVARRLAVDLAPLFTVVSGLAVGIDTAAHQAALESGGRTFGVAACGLDQDYPKGTGDLRGRIPEHGALLSEYPPMVRAATHHFPARNYLMAGLCLGVVVVEASEESGALVTARAALEEGREVFAIPGDITRRNSRGANGLIQQGAPLVTCAADVIAHLEFVLGAELEERRRTKAPAVDGSDPNSSPPSPPLAGAEGALLEAIRHTQRSYDELVAAFVPEEMSLGEMAGALLKLELKGLVKQLPGKAYMARALGR